MAASGFPRAGSAAQPCFPAKPARNRNGDQGHAHHPDRGRFRNGRPVRVRGDEDLEGGTKPAQVIPLPLKVGVHVAEQEGQRNHARKPHGARRDGIARLHDHPVDGALHHLRLGNRKNREGNRHFIRIAKYARKAEIDRLKGRAGKPIVIRRQDELELVQSSVPLPNQTNGVETSVDRTRRNGNPCVQQLTPRARKRIIGTKRTEDHRARPNRRDEQQSQKKHQIQIAEAYAHAGSFPFVEDFPRAVDEGLRAAGRVKIRSSLGTKSGEKKAHPCGCFLTPS